MSAAKRMLFLAASLLALVAVSVVGAAGGAPPGKDHEDPSAPKNLRVSAVTQTLVRLAWDPSTDNVAVAGYYVFGNQGKATVETGLDKPEYTVSGLACGQSSDLTVVAFDDAQNRSEKATMTVSSAPCTDTLPPAMPSGFKQVATSDDAVVLAWNPSVDNVGVVGYGVYRNLQRIASPTDPTVPLDGLDCGSSYDYAVDAVDAAGNRSPLAKAYVQTSACPSSTPPPPPPPSDTQAPSTPSGLAASSITQSALTLSWNASTDNVQVTGYDLYRDGTKVASPSSPGASQSGLACGTSYAFAVEALDAAGNRSSRATLTTSTSACSTTTPPPPPSTDTQPPSTPTGLAASSITQSALTLSWNASTDNVQVTGYDLYRDGTKVASPSSPGASQSGLACGTSYAFAVEALDAAGNRSSRATLTTSTSACSTTTPPPPPSTDTQPPSTPTGLGVSSATRTSASLSWNPSTDNVAVAGYRSYRDGVYQSTTTQPPTTVSGLSCGSAYTFEVDAFDAQGNASKRASVIGSTLACPDTQAPSAPTGVVASSRTATSIALIWNASTDNVGVVGYGLYRPFAATDSSSSTTGIFSGLTCNTNYTLAVDAYDAAGNRSDLTTVMVSTTACPDTTPPSAPTGLAASSVTQTGLALAWNASSDNVGVTSYDVYRNSTKVATVTSNSSSQTGLNCGTSYTFGVVARDAAGNSSAATSLNVSTSACPAPTWTSSIADGQSVLTGATWTATVSPTPDAVELWATPLGQTQQKLKTDTSAPYDVVLNLTPGTYILGACAVQGTVRTCFDDRKTVSVTAAVSSSSGSSSSPYFVADYQNGSFGSPWTLLFSYSSPGWLNLGTSTGTSDGRVKIAAPPGSSESAARFEIRDSDPGWPIIPTVQKSEVRTDAQHTFDQSAVSVGDVRWFSTRIYLPYTSSEKFELAHGGSNDYTDLMELHTGSDTGWSAFHLAPHPTAGNLNQWMYFTVYGGAFESTQYREQVNLWRLTDGSGNRVMSNYNRWIDLVWGMRFAPDNTGWLEAWVDGVNVYPRKNRPTMWSGDTQTYFKYGLYKPKDASFPESGRSVVYFGRTTIGLAKP